MAGGGAICASGGATTLGSFTTGAGVSGAGDSGAKITVSVGTSSACAANEAGESASAAAIAAEVLRRV